MSDCSNHKKEVAGITDMKVLAEMIGDLHYETLTEFIKQLALKMKIDSIQDEDNGRVKLGGSLYMCHYELINAWRWMDLSWKVSKPFMNNNPTQP